MTSFTDILLVEDEQNIAEAIRFILSRDGWRLAMWPEGGGALQQIVTLRPRMVILDVMLPARSGIEVLAAVRDDHRIATTPVLLLTARGLNDAQTSGAHMADRILAKPFDNTELRRVVAEMIGPAR